MNLFYILDFRLLRIKSMKNLLKTILLIGLYIIVPNILLSQEAKINEVRKLIQLSEKNQFDKPRKSLRYGFAAEKLYKGNDVNLQSEILYQISYAFFNIGEIDSAVYFSEKILKFKDIDLKIKGKVNSFLSVLFRKKAKFKKALFYAEEAKSYYKKAGDEEGFNQAEMNIGKIYHINGNNEKALAAYFDVLKYYKSKNDSLREGQLYGVISDVYAETGNVEKGKYYNYKAIELLENFSNYNIYADALNNYGIYFYDEKNYDEAIHYFSEALNVYLKNGKKDAVAAAKQNVGICYIYTGSKKKGFQYLHEAFTIFKEFGLNDVASVMTDLGTAYTYTGNVDSAYYYLSEANKIADKINNTYYKKETLRLLSELYKKNHNTKKALQYFEKFIAYKDSLDNEKMKETLNELEIKYQTSEKEKEILRLKDHELLDKANKRLLIIGIISIVLISILIIIRIQTKRKKDAEIQKQKILVHQKERELIKAKLEQKEIEEKRLKDEIEFKTKQLAGHALNMMQKNKLLQELTEKISEKTKTMSDDGKKELFSVKKQLEIGLNVDKDWDLFKIYFEQINESFFDKLKEINPKLSSNDFRLSALIKLNLSLKESASVLNISPESVKNARYRLKKKLNLNGEQDLTQFINNL